VIDKFRALAEALDGVTSGMTVAVGGFGGSGIPNLLAEELRGRGLHDLVVVANGAGGGTSGLAGLIIDGCVRTLVCSYPMSPAARAVGEVLATGAVEVQLTPQGVLAERLRAGAAGLGGILSPVGIGTPFAAGKDVVTVSGRDFLLERPIVPDVALIRATEADRWGNLRFRLASRNFNVVMAMAARHTIAEVAHRRELGEIEPETVHLPGVFIDAVVSDGTTPDRATSAGER
jgi:3-oxoadipate CoA-transferase, alpha subunit